MAFTRDWNEASPDGGDAASSGDDEIRHFKVEVSDRIKALVYGFIAGENDGVPGCKHLPFKAQSSDPTVGASTIVLYSKDVSGEAHLYMKDESNDVRQISKAAGLMNIIAGDYAANSVDEDDIELANNAALTAKNAAGTGTVDLIKAGTNDLPTLPDSAEMASNAAPVEDEAIVNKKYVDDQIAAKVTLSAETNEDSDSTAMLKAHAYEAQTDGYVFAVVQLTTSGHIIAGFVANTNDPAGTGVTQDKAEADANNSWKGVSFLVPSGKFFEITSDSGTPGIYWRSMGTLSKPVDQD